jgi:phenylalanyl-tRNA synthetase beta chain
MLTFEQINKTIGQEISKDDISNILNGLEIKIDHSNEEGMLIEIPRYRVDVTRPADVIEEILRIYGYNNVNTAKLLQSNVPDFIRDDDHQIAERLSNQLVSLGFNEMINNSITSPDYQEIFEEIKGVKGVNIINPLGQELSQMRTSLLPSALEVVAFNLNRQSKSLKLFELGKTYQQKNGVFEEEKFLSLTISGDVHKENWNVTHQPQVFFYLKGVIHQLLRKNCPIQWEEQSTDNDIFSEGLRYTYKGNSLLQFGFIKKEICDKFDINQEVVYAELDFTKITDLARNNNIRYQVKPKFPQVRRDFALLLDNEITFDALKHIALKTEKNILNSIQLFDVYEGDKLPKGKKSYGVSFYFQDSKKTLTDKHVDKIMGKLQIKFETQLGAQLR